MEGNSITTFQNLCKIFEMRIKLDNAKGVTTASDVIDNYEKYAQKIDTLYNEEFQGKLKNLISPCDTLEAERERLEKLINLLEDRLSKRSSLVVDYHNATGKYIKNLQLIVSESELNNKKERLSHITKYLDTVKEIEDIKDSVSKLKDNLEEEENKKDEYLEKNKLLEDELYSAFVTSVGTDEYYGNIEEENILDILSDVSKKAKECKETLDITKESVESLLSSGMNDEYEAYIDEASKSYSLWKDREIILSIYKLVINFVEEFNDLLAKRKTINELFAERKTLNINSNLLLSFEEVVSEQDRVLDNEKGILENIANYTSRIDFKEERLKELEEVIKEPEILAILGEYNIKSSDENKITTEDIILLNDDINPSFQDNEKVVVKEYNPYEIVSVDDYPLTLNVGLAKLKGASVRDKVNKKLNGDDVLSDFHKVENNLNIKEENDSTVNVSTGDNKDEQKSEETNKIDVLSEISVPTEDKNINNIEMVESGSVPTNTEVNNSFWIPVSDAKLDTGEFPNINIPVTPDNMNMGEDNFGFPETDVKGDEKNA